MTVATPVPADRPPRPGPVPPRPIAAPRCLSQSRAEAARRLRHLARQLQTASAHPAAPAPILALFER